jgi:integrase
VNKNIIPAMGALQLSRLKPAQISDAYAKALSGPPGRKSWRSSSSHGGLYPSRVEAGFEPSSPLGRTRSQSADASAEWHPMQTYDFAQTVELLELVRDTPIFIPVLLTVFCGLRRGDALRWREVDLVAGQVSVARSMEQTKGGKSKGLRFKSPKSGKGRTVALPSTVIEELQAYRIKRAQEFLRLGKGLSDDDRPRGRLSHGPDLHFAEVGSVHPGSQPAP